MRGEGISQFLADPVTRENDEQCARASARISGTADISAGIESTVVYQRKRSSALERRVGERIRAVRARSVKKFAFGVGRYNSRERSLFCITSSAQAEIYDRSHLSCRDLREPRLLSWFTGISSLARPSPVKLARIADDLTLCETCV